MGKINILPSEIFNLISAGEVVERPSSVVKELVENSIDAGATEITINIENGGISKIEISDNGIGVLAEDIKAVFLPHATSKLKDAEDLNMISTLGFRGEAMASIARVSEIELVSKPKNQATARKIFVKAGEILDLQEIVDKDGTRTIVKNLFFNTPVRLKFLKKPKSEERLVTQTMQNIIFANPDIAFNYSVDGKLIFSTDGKSLVSAMHEIYSRNDLKEMFEHSYEKHSSKFVGWLSKPTHTKPNRSYQTVIINGRVVTCQIVSMAIERAYKPYLMKRSFPMFIASLILPFDMVDVNVHPTKAEVRFADNNLVFGFVYNAVKDFLEFNTHQNMQSNSNTKTVKVKQEKIDKLFNQKNVIANQNDLVETVKQKINIEKPNDAEKNLITSNKIIKAVDLNDFSNSNSNKTIINTKIESDKNEIKNINFERKSLEVEQKNQNLEQNLKSNKLKNQILNNAKCNVSGLKNFGSIGNSFCDKNFESLINSKTENNKKNNSNIENNDKLIDCNNISENLQTDKLYKQFDNNVSEKIEIQSLVSATLDKNLNNGISNNVERKTQENEQYFTENIKNDFDNEINKKDFRENISAENKLFEKLPYWTENSKIIGQLFDTYILLSNGNDFYIIDQHAAHEKILFDKLVANLENNFSQPLLIPYEIQTNAIEFETLQRILPSMKKIGFCISKNSNDNFEILEVPLLLVDMKIEKFINSILNDLSVFSDIKLDDILHEKLCQMACKSAIKAGNVLSNEQIAYILSVFFDENGNLPKQCPHGRPAILKIKKNELEKMFKRIV